MRFDYKLDGAGWAIATVGEAGRELAMTVSYLNDSLAQLTEAILGLMAGEEEATVVFMAEPGEHHCVLRRTGRDGVAVQIRWFKDWASWDMYPADEYKVAFECTSTLPEIRDEVVAALGRVLAEHGIEGYKGKWVEHDFPAGAYERLRSA